MKYNTRGLPVVDVVVDPHLSLKLRPHQRDGVIFLYECMMNMREYNGSGAILALVINNSLILVNISNQLINGVTFIHIVLGTCMYDFVLS